MLTLTSVKDYLMADRPDRTRIFPSLLARARNRTENGADLLFDRLKEPAHRPAQAAETFTRIAELVRGGVWSDEIAELLRGAQAVLAANVRQDHPVSPPEQ